MANEKTETGKKQWKLAFVCEKTKEVVHLVTTAPSFKCPDCGLTLRWLEEQRKFGAHGKDDRTIGHQLRSAQEAE
jgi:predicted RNA-binding Zn-ribbon protein involved in translation (DUF1610 family)